MTRVLLVVLDGATPAILSPMIDAGAVPTLARIVDEGASGPLRCAPPLVRAMAFTTLATGVRAPRHGVCADVVVRPDGAGVSPAGRPSWTVPALWEGLAAAGHSCAVVGWPATAPATAWTGVTLVDDVHAEPLGDRFATWPMPPDCVAPSALRDALRSLRVHPADLDGAAIRSLVPLAARVDQDEDPRLARLARVVARTASVHAAATHLAESASPAFMAVCYPLIADVQREFLGCRPPAMPGIDCLDAAVYGPVVERAIELQDAMLGVLVGALDPATTVIVVSPYGFASGNDRPPREVADRLPAAIAWHRAPGVLAMRGPGIAADTLVHGASVEDIAPTVLALYGLRAPGLDGRALESVVASSGIETEVTLPALDAAVPEAFIDDAELSAAQRRVVSAARLGELVARAEAELAQGNAAAAAATYERVIVEVPRDWPARVRLARCRLQLGELDACATLARDVIEAAPGVPWGYLLGATIAVLRGDDAAADPLLAATRERTARLPNVSLRLAALYLLRGDALAAEALFSDALDAMPTSVDAHDGLGCALHAQGRHLAAVQVLRAGLGHGYHAPLVHVHLGMALAALGRADDATSAARTARAQDPTVPGLQALEASIAHLLAARKHASN